MSIVSDLLDQVLARAQQAGLDQAQLARAAGLAPETISRAKKRGTMDLASIEALARVTGLRLGLAPVETQSKARTTNAPTRSPLAHPKWGLAWSNNDLDDDTLIRNALAQGGFMLLLEAVKAHGMEEVMNQWNQVKAGLKPRMQAEVERQLHNIQHGVSHAQA
jgi:transcriptional regulator with XRE-family HTH domain